jgi:hypothetical protein
MDQIKSFRDTIVAKTNLSLNPGERLTVRYTDRDGNIISREFAGKATVNDKPVDFDRWPLADSPWVRQISKTAPLTVTDGKMTRTYDLLNWRISEAHDRP